MEDFLKLRKQLDAYSQLTLEMKTMENLGISCDYKDVLDNKLLTEVVGHIGKTTTKELQAAANHILLAKAWTGKLLGYLSVPTPYEADKDRNEVADIKPTDARVDIGPWKERNNWSAKKDVQKISSLRDLLQTALDFIQGYFPATDAKIDNMRSFAICRTKIEEHLVEARFQFGFELARIRDEEANGPSKDIDTPLYGGFTQKR